MPVYGWILKSTRLEIRTRITGHYAYKDVTLEENALIVLPQAIEVLKDAESTQEEKLLALRSLIHIAGDIHVPLHCGYKKDAGGHKPKLTWEDTQEKTNLHKVWDTDLIHRYNEDVDSYVDGVAKTNNQRRTRPMGNC